MKYILNETAYKTTNGFNINNIKLDFDIPKIDNIKYFDNNEITQNIKDDEFKTKIGLIVNKYLDINIDLKNDLVLNYDFNNENKNLVASININNAVDNKNLYIVLKSNDDSINFNYLRINTITNSEVNINVINLLNSNSYSFIAYENNVNKNGNLTINHFDIESKFKINNCYTLLNEENAKNTVNTLYIGKDEDKLDYNIHIKNIAPKTTSNIITEGVLDNNSYKQHKGIIDFIEGSKESVGSEIENVTLLSDSALSRSCPMLMCHEENVIGSHGVSTGKINQEKLFYLMSRGLSEKDAKITILLGNFSKIINNLNNENLKEQVTDYIMKFIIK